MLDFKLKNNIKDSIFAFGSFISNPQILGDISILRKGIEVMSSLDISTIDNILRPAYYMVLAEAYRNCITISGKGFINYDNDDIVLHIQNLRLAIRYSQGNKDFENIQCINLGHALNDLKRYAEAIKCWESVIVNREHSTQAVIGILLYNFSVCILGVVPLLPLKSMVLQFISIGKKCHSDALNCDGINRQLENNIQDALSRVCEYERLFEEHLFQTDSTVQTNVLKDISTYSIWCINEVLYLNPLNDILASAESAVDIIDLSFLKDEKDVFVVLGYDELKQQYLFSREILYESFTQQNDDKSKVSFRLAYSILDKLAGLINSYFELGLKNSILSYNKIWFDKSRRINSELAKTRNPYLIALYWISRDIFLEGEEASDPEAADIAKCRNFIEHRFVKIEDGDSFEELHNGLMLLIGRKTLYEKSLKLHCLVRNALLYFYFAVRWQDMNDQINDVTVKS